jgi:hypothetical protein
VIDVHRREAALVVMGVPERKLLSAMRRAECIVDIEDLLLTRPYRRAGLIDKSGGEPRRLRLARRILQTTDRRLRGQRRAGLRTAPNRDLHQRVMPQPVEQTRAITISNIACRMRLASRRSGIAPASRLHTPSSRSALLSSSRPPLED